MKWHGLFNLLILEYSSLYGLDCNFVIQTDRGLRKLLHFPYSIWEMRTMPWILNYLNYTSFAAK